MSRLLIAVVATVFGLVAFSPPSQATSALYVTPVEQANLSTAVVVATVGRVEVDIHPEWKRPMTLTRVVVEQVIVGSAPASLVIEQLGGAIDGHRLYIPGDARLEPGERCLIFLRQVDGTWYLTAMEQSKYRIVDSPGGPMLLRQLSGGMFVRNPQGRLEEYEEPGYLRTRSLREMTEVLRSTVSPSQEEGR